MIKLLFSFLLVLSIAMGGLFLLERQSIYEQVNTDIANSVALEREGLHRRVSDWESALNGIAHIDAIRRLLSSTDNTNRMMAERRAIEQVFTELQRRNKEQFIALRLVDRFGVERVVVRNMQVESNLKNISTSPQFRRVMSQRPFQLIPIIDMENGNAAVSLNINISANGIIVGAIIMEINTAELLRFLGSDSIADSARSIYFVNDKGQVVFHSLAAQEISLEGRKLKHVLDILDEQGSENYVLKQDGSLWGAFKQETLNTQVLFSFSSNRIMSMIWQNMIPKGILLVVTVLASLLLFGGGRRKREDGEGFTYSLPGVISKSDKSNTIKTQELTNISNEIRTPINSILGMLSLLGETKLSSKQNEYVDLANKSGEWVLELINELSDYSKLKANQLTLEQIDFDLRNTIKDVTEMLSIEAYKKGLEATCLINSLVPERVNGDPSRLRQVLINLISHAIKFTDHGDIAVSATVIKTEDDLTWVRFEVSDTGMGLDSELQKEFFDAPETSYASSESEYNTSNLGLTLSKKIIEMMKGKIGVGENSCGGATFWFEIPYALASVSNKRHVQSDLDGHRVYLVGEVDGNRKTIGAVLDKWGLECESSGDFENAHKVIAKAAKKQSPFSFFLIDISLSSSGDKAFQLVRKIREQKSIAETNIIILTAKGTPGEGQIARDLGVKAYLSKPINRSQLHDTLRQVVGSLDSLNTLPMVTKHSLKENAEAGHSVLLVEDNITNQKVLAGFLSRLGLNADIATSGQEALESIKKRAYDLVIMDTQMPEMDGLETTRRVREYEHSLALGDDKSVERAIRTPIIALATSFLDDEKEDCLKVGMDGFLKKPVNMKSMEDLLIQWGLVETNFAQVS